MGERCLVHGNEMHYDLRSGFEICSVCEAEQAARQPGPCDYTADLRSDLQKEEYRLKYLSACAKEGQEALRVGMREVISALAVAREPAGVGAREAWIDEAASRIERWLSVDLELDTPPDEWVKAQWNQVYEIARRAILSMWQPSSVEKYGYPGAPREPEQTRVRLEDALREVNHLQHSLAIELDPIPAQPRLEYWTRKIEQVVCAALAVPVPVDTPQGGDNHGDRSICPSCGHQSHAGVSCLESDCCGCGQ